MSIFKKNIKPHAFSWITWTIVLMVVFFAMHTSGAEAGAWHPMVGGILCGIVSVIALFRGERNITRSDYFALATAVGALPLWAMTQNALYAVILLTFIDTVGFYPTFRKSYISPHEESLRWAFQGGLVCLCSFLAIKIYNWTTALYPAVMVLMHIALGMMLIWRRRCVANKCP